MARAVQAFGLEAAMLALGAPAWALLLLVALKIGFDPRAHLREHKAP